MLRNQDKVLSLYTDVPFRLQQQHVPDELHIPLMLLHLQKKNPASIKICAFIDKKERREVDICADYVGFDIPCGFVIGYGLDYAEKYRDFPFLAEIIDVEELLRKKSL